MLVSGREGPCVDLFGQLPNIPSRRGGVSAEAGPGS